MSLLHNAIRCTECQHLFFSTAVTDESRVHELITKLGQHYELRHKETLSRYTLSTKELALVVVARAFINNLAIIPDDNTALKEYAGELDEKLFSMLGYDQNEEEEDDDTLVESLQFIMSETTDENTKRQLEAVIEDLTEEVTEDEVSEIEESNEKPTEPITSPPEVR